MRRTRTIMTIGVLACVAGACEHDGTGLLVGGAGPATVVGLWTGTEEITGETDIRGGPVGAMEEGIRFPVALKLSKHRRFTLRVSRFPVSGGGSEDRTCRGVWERDGRTLALFPDSACRALPFAEYVIGRSLPDGMTLEASSGRTATGGVQPGNIRVVFALDRD